jgi:hypothetical protein
MTRNGQNDKKWLEMMHLPCHPERGEGSQNGHGAENDGNNGEQRNG